MNIDLYEKRRPTQQDIIGLPIVVSFSMDGRLEQEGIRYPKTKFVRLGPHLRLGEFDMGVTQVSPIYRSDSLNFDYWRYRGALTSALSEQKMGLMPCTGAIFDFIPLQTEREGSPELAVYLARPDCRTGNYVVDRMTRSGYRVEKIVGSRERRNTEILCLADELKTDAVVQIAVAENLITDQVVRNGLHMTRFIIELRKMLLIEGVVLGRPATDVFTLSSLTPD